MVWFAVFVDYSGSECLVNFDWPSQPLAPPCMAETVNFRAVQHLHFCVFLFRARNEQCQSFTSMEAALSPSLGISY